MSFDWSAFIQTAKAETRERLQALNDGLLRLEGERQNTGLVDEVFRHAHSIKGSAQMVGLEMVGRIAHGLEDLLGNVRSGSLPISPPLLDVAFQALDAIQQLLDDIPDGSLQQRAEAMIDRLGAAAAGDLHPEAAPTSAGAPSQAPARELAQPAGHGEHAQAAPDQAPVSEPTPGPLEAGIPEQVAADATVVASSSDPASASAPSVAGGGSDTVRVATERLDHLLAIIGELTALERREHALAQELREMNSWLRTRVRHAPSHPSEPDAQEVLAQVRTRAAGLSQAARRMSTTRALLTREVRDAAMDLRLLPVATLFERFPRPIRDLARAAGKEVRLVVEGDETRLDKRILDELYDPLLHLLRNAIDHAIEPPREREAAGKPATGTVTLRAVPRGRSVLLQVGDDGRGIHVEKVRQVACDRAFCTPAEAATLSTDQLLLLLFRPGFSTATQVTSVSGRGVGLDVVQTNVRNLKGVVRVETRAGAGTTFTLEIPLTLATTRVLLMECAGRVYALAGALVRGVVEVAPGTAERAHAQPTFTWGGRTVPLLPLESALSFSNGTPAERRPAVLVECDGRTVGILADRVLDEEEVVLKPLGSLLRQARLVSAGTAREDGRVALLLNVDAVCAAGSRRRPQAPGVPVEEHATQTRTILLADDTLTTREIERAILEAAGYRVVAAPDGVAAWDELSRHSFDLVVADVEMPRMDGITLTRLITSDARTAHIPVVIVTSLASDVDRRRGLDAGAAAYIVKSAFDQENLLDLIERLIQ